MVLFSVILVEHLCLKFMYMKNYFLHTTAGQYKNNTVCKVLYLFADIHIHSACKLYYENAY